MDVLTVGEALVEFVKGTKDSPHYEIGNYRGPFPSGAPAIFADAAARLGLKSGFVGAVGSDDFGKVLRERLFKDSVDVTHLKTVIGYTTGIAFVMYFSSGERSFVFHLKQSAATQVSPDDIDEDLVRSSRVLHVMGSALTLGEGMREACYKAVRIANRFGAIISYDPNLRSELLSANLIAKMSEPLLRTAELVMPSRKELLDLTGKRMIREAADQLLKQGIPNVIVKLGADGSMAITKNGAELEPAYELQEIDPTGAGDAFDAGFICEYLAKKPMRDTLRFANAVGGLKALRVGPMEVPESKSEVTQFMKGAKQRVTSKQPD